MITENPAAEEEGWTEVTRKGSSSASINSGKPIKCDTTTKEKEFLGYARFLVEVKVGMPLPDTVEFLDEKGVLQKQQVHYEWKPLVCARCHEIGHDEEMCRKAGGNKRPTVVKKVWVPKVIPKPKVAEAHHKKQDSVEGPLPMFDPATVVTPMPYQGTVLNSITPARMLPHRREGIQSGPFFLEAVNNSLRRNILNSLGKGRDCERVDLWSSLKHLKNSLVDPWLIMRDFNNVLHSDERIGSPVTQAEVQGFQDCVDECGLYDLVSSGAFYTWNNKQEGVDRVFSRIDRVMANDQWLLQGPSGTVTFLPEGLYDHSPCLMEL
ncbi:uncharacterized protein LOC141613597 [Silene latifolia]|uniref:uncharacterized protein LOC141613597 n=1 Tax=Silene latifolia TaxID=37657 RepID=UPI003D77F854